MKALRCLLPAAIVLAMGCQGYPRREIPPGEILTERAGMLLSIGFGYDGVAYLHDLLYVTCNVGIIEIKGRLVQKLHRWNPVDGVISGPWPVSGKQLLWFHEDATGDLLRWNGEEWRRIPMPPPYGRDHFTREDVLGGLRGVTDGNTFFLIARRYAWRWDEDTWDWQNLPLPPDTWKLSGVAALSSGVLYFQRHERSYLGSLGARRFDPDTVHYTEGGKWHSVSHQAGPFIALEVVSRGDAAYLRTHHGRLLKADREGVEAVTIPGFCEGIGLGSKNQLIVVIRGKGVFLEGEELQKLFDNPHPTDPDLFRIHVTERNGTYVYATRSFSKKVDPSSGPWRTPASVGIWISKGDRLVRVDMPQ